MGMAEEKEEEEKEQKGTYPLGNLVPLDCVCVAVLVSYYLPPSHLADRYNQKDTSTN